ncbi:MAG: MBL fold metallo-hydrolase [Gammaproteobacteria bacterium]|nr:MBL fold metallo-hydrolase [Gammaproteobacteria bacterium]
MAQSCGTAELAVQVLGSGGPELADKRASSSYLIWIDGKARVLVDAGGGAALRFSEAGATVSDLDVILFSHLHVDHANDLPALVKSSYFEDRTRALPIYGPLGNKFMPSTVAYVRALFDGTHGVYRYLGDFLSPLNDATYKLQPRNVDFRSKLVASRKTSNKIKIVFTNEHMRISATPVLHGAIPALAWSIESKGKRIVFSGDTNGEDGNLELLAAQADLLIAHNAVPEDAGGVERQLHMSPSVIGRIAQTAEVKQLVLSHRMRRTLGHETETLGAIKKHYNGPSVFANDLDCFKP